MKLDMAFSGELEYVKKNNIPVVIAGGTVEYHGPHCSYGCDTLVVQGLIEKLAERKEILITILKNILTVLCMMVQTGVGFTRVFRIYCPRHTLRKMARATKQESISLTEL